MKRCWGVHSKALTEGTIQVSVATRPSPLHIPTSCSAALEEAPRAERRGGRIFCRRGFPFFGISFDLHEIT